MRPPKKIPFWLWKILARSLGIKLDPMDRPLVSSVLHILTTGSGFVMFLTRLWFCGYDISSLRTQSDILDGAMTMIMMTLFLVLGIYAHRLVFRLLVHPKFRDMVKLHSKTVLKLNAALVIFVVMAVFVVVVNVDNAHFVNLYAAEEDRNSSVEVPPSAGRGGSIPLNQTRNVNPCQTVGVPLVICGTYWISQVIYSIFFLVWNGLVAMILVSVARTHTLDIRRLIWELDCDAYLIDKRRRKQFYKDDSEDSRDSLRAYLWMDSDQIGKVFMDQDDNQAEEEVAGATNRAEVEIPDRIIEADDEPDLFANGPEIKLKLSDAPKADGGRYPSEKNFSGISKVTRSLSTFRRFRKLSEGLGSVEVDGPIRARIMDEEEILHKYWKAMAGTKLTSQAFQRWMTVVLTTIMLWSSVRIVHWLSHAPTLTGVMSFIFPLVLLPLIASAYAEVNFEATKIIQSIAPTPERMSISCYMEKMPIHLNTYGYPISYGTMGTVIAAITAAFASKVLLQEMSSVIIS